MADLPDEMWRQILEIGIRSSNLTYKDLCCVSISCRRLHRLSNDAVLWSFLLSSDFPHTEASVSNGTVSSSSSSPKLMYRIKFDRERARKAAAHRRAVLRLESQIAGHLRNLQEIQMKLTEETEKMKAAVTELPNLRKVRQASVALNLWQPEVIRGWQKQMVGQCVVPVDARINALEMELRLCRQQIAGFDNAYRNEKRRLDAAKERLVIMKYHPLRDYKSTSSGVDECNSQRKKLKRGSDSKAPGTNEKKLKLEDA